MITIENGVDGIGSFTPASSGPPDSEQLAWTEGLAAEADELLGNPSYPSFPGAHPRRNKGRVGVQAAPLSTRHADQVYATAGSAVLDAVVRFLLRTRVATTGTELRAATLELTSANLCVLGLIESGGALVPPIPVAALSEAAEMVASLAAAASQPPVAPAGSAMDADPETSGTYMLKQFQPLIDLAMGIAKKQQASLEATAQSRRQEMLLAMLEHAELPQLPDTERERIRSALRAETAAVLPPLESMPESGR